MAEIPRQANVAVARVVGRLGAQVDRARVGAAVVDEDRLGGPVEPVEERVQPVQEHRQHRFFVEYGDDDAVAHAGVGLARHWLNPMYAGRAA